MARLPRGVLRRIPGERLSFVGALWAVKSDESSPSWLSPSMEADSLFRNDRVDAPVGRKPLPDVGETTCNQSEPDLGDATLDKAGREEVGAWRDVGRESLDDPDMLEAAEKTSS